MNEQGKMMNQHQHQHQQQPHLMNLNQNMMSMNQMNPPQSQPQMLPMNRGYGLWPQPPPFPKPNLNPNPNSGAMKPPLSASFRKRLGPRGNWKGKKVNTDKRRNDQQKLLMAAGGSSGLSGGLGVPNFNNYQPPTLNELQHQNRMKTRKFFPKNNFNNKNMNLNMIGNNHNFNNSRSAPFAPRNTTSFIIRAKRSGGIPSVAPSPVTPAVLPTPNFSPSREVLVDMAKEEWGVDGYGSMKGLIRLRSPGHEMESHEDDDEEETGSSESDVEEHVEVERRLDHDLSRFEMIYNPSSVNVNNMDYHSMLENRVDDQDSRIVHLEQENLILKEKLFLMEREVGDMRRRMQCLEVRGNNEEDVENESENVSGSREGHSVENNREEFSENTNGGGDDTVDEDDKRGKASDVEGKEGNKNDGFVGASNKNDGVFDFEDKTENNGETIAEADNGEGKEENTEYDEATDIEVNNDKNAGEDVHMGKVGVVEGPNTVSLRGVEN